MESHDDRTMGHLRPIKTKQLICIHAVASHVLHPKARPPKHACASSKPAIPNTHVHMPHQRAARTLARPSLLSLLPLPSLDTWVKNAFNRLLDGKLKLVSQ